MAYYNNYIVTGIGSRGFTCHGRATRGPPTQRPSQGLTTLIRHPPKFFIVQEVNQIQVGRDACWANDDAEVWDLDWRAVL